MRGADASEGGERGGSSSHGGNGADDEYTRWDGVDPSPDPRPPARHDVGPAADGSQARCHVRHERPPRTNASEVRDMPLRSRMTLLAGIAASVALAGCQTSLP